MMIEIQTIEGGEKDVSSLEGTTLKNVKKDFIVSFKLFYHRHLWACFNGISIKFDNCKSYLTTKFDSCCTLLIFAFKQNCIYCNYVTDINSD